MEITFPRSHQKAEFRLLCTPSSKSGVLPAGELIAIYFAFISAKGVRFWGADAFAYASDARIYSSKGID